MKYFLLFYVALGAAGILSFAVGIFDKKRRRGWFWVAAALFGLFLIQAILVLLSAWIIMTHI